MKWGYNHLVRHGPYSLVHRFLQALFRIWDQDEWFYYAKSGFDPQLPAFQRWEVLTKVADKPPASRAEELLPLKNHWVILRDKYCKPDEVVFFHTDKDKCDVLVEGSANCARARRATSYKMIHGRNLTSSTATGQPARRS
jgi:hypothetical protein